MECEKAHTIGRPNAAKYLDEALRYILGHNNVWTTTADDIAEYYIANYYDQVASWIAARQAQPYTPPTTGASTKAGGRSPSADRFVVSTLASC